jgi:DNA-binding winged helix-turn-helix (wHTH) protein
VAQLRQKIEPDTEHPRLILTIPGVGYRFNDDLENDDTEHREKERDGQAS